MKNILKVWNIIKPIIRYVILACTGVSILLYHDKFQINFMIPFLLNVFLISFTFVYLNYVLKKKSDTKFIIISIVLFMSICIMSNTSNFYYFIIMDDIFDITDEKIRKKFIIFHFLGWIMYLIIHKSIIIQLDSIISCLVIYIFTLIVFNIIHNYRYERDKLKILNSDLIEYSFKEREYIVSQERSRISQELHDSIGHSLMALSMNIRYLKALNDKEKIQNEICEIDNLVKESIKVLRTTVYNLKELDETIDLKQEINNITKKFNTLGIVKINFDCENDISDMSKKIQNILITIIKEGITNSLKHGNPTIIDISIESVNEKLYLIIKDNGEGVKIIKKSNGLNGIERRVKNIKGKVKFVSSSNKGFTIKVLLPGGILND